jgi:predicted amino acid-binding ACT domain protein
MAYHSVFESPLSNQEVVMPDQVRRVEYVHVLVKDRPGQAAEVLGALGEEGIDLLAFSGFPSKGAKGQLDLVTGDIAGVKRVAKSRKWKLSAVKRSFLVQGDDRVGAVAAVLGKLAGAKINVIAADAVSAGAGRYAMILWVKPASYARAAKVLEAV